MFITCVAAIICANMVWDFLMLFIDWRKGNMSDKYVTLDEFMNERGDFVKQVVYRVDGDFLGNITGENVTVILMGDGDIIGNIDAKNGEIVLINGDINGDVKANKILCQNSNPNITYKTCKTCKFYVADGIITGTGHKKEYCTKIGLIGDIISCNGWERGISYNH